MSTVTDRPLTRRRRKELEEAGLTPAMLTPASVAGAKAGNITPKNLDAAMKLLEKDAENTQAVGNKGDGDAAEVAPVSSPVDTWIKGEKTAVEHGSPTPATPCLDDTSGPRTPTTSNPSIQLDRGESALSPLSPLTRMLGPTPNNTPAAGLPPARMSEGIIGRAVQGLTEDALSFSPHPATQAASTPPFLGTLNEDGTPSITGTAPAPTPSLPAGPVADSSSLSTPPLLTPELPESSMPASNSSVAAMLGSAQVSAPSTDNQVEDLIADLDRLATSPNMQAPDNTLQQAADPTPSPVTYMQAGVPASPLSLGVASMVDVDLDISTPSGASFQSSPAAATPPTGAPTPGLPPTPASAATPQWLALSPLGEPESALSAQAAPLTASPAEGALSAAARAAPSPSTQNTLSSLSTPTMMSLEAPTPNPPSAVTNALFTPDNETADRQEQFSDLPTDDTLTNVTPADNFIVSTPLSRMPYIAAEFTPSTATNITVSPPSNSWLASKSPLATAPVQGADQSAADNELDEPMDTEEAPPAPNAGFSFPALESAPEAATSAEAAAEVQDEGVSSPPVCALAGKSHDTVGDGGDTPPALQQNGMDDDMPTPLAFGPAAKEAPATADPSTPEEQQVKAFGMSAGSCFATPEVPIHTGMTSLTTVEMRAAARHIPAWNRISKLVGKESPLVYSLVTSMWDEPALQHWAITPWKLLEGVCRSRGWTLTMRNATDKKLTASASTMATVNIPEGLGTTIVGNGKCPGQLESLIVAAAAALEELLKRNLITAKDAHAAASLASAPAPNATIPNLGRTPRPRPGVPLVAPPPPTAFNRSGAPLPPRTAPVSRLTATSSAATPTAAKPAASAIVPQLTPVVPAQTEVKEHSTIDTSDMMTNAYTADGRDIMDCMPTPEHPGIGVRAPQDTGACPTPEMVLVPPIVKPKTKNSTAGFTPPVKKSTTDSVVYHPPFRTGKTAVANKAKATVAATAKPTGLAAIKQHQQELERIAKQNKSQIMALTERLGNVKIAADKTAKSPAPLKGMPLPQGRHIVFADDGEVMVREHQRLRGVPKAAGKHTHFDSDGEDENLAGY